jgi:hypothetical protein
VQRAQEDNANLVLLNAVYRANLKRKWPPGFQVPDETVKAWKNDFTKSYLRSFLTFCLRTKMDEWLQYIKHCLKKNRDPWQQNTSSANKLVTHLEQWMESDWVSENWQNSLSEFGLSTTAMPEELISAEKLRIAREQMVINIRQALRAKGKGE